MHDNFRSITIFGTLFKRACERLFFCSVRSASAVMQHARASGASCSSITRLNAGGKVLQTSRHTLAVSDGNAFVDNDDRLFSELLESLCTSQRPRPCVTAHWKSQPLHECHFSTTDETAMIPCADILLAWVIGGTEVRRWHAVPRSAFLDSIVTEDFLDDLPGEVEVVHGLQILRRPLHMELSKCVGSDDGQLLFGLVRTQRYKNNDCDLVPYLCTDGETAVRIPELQVRFTFPKGQRQRFSHGYHAMVSRFVSESKSHIGRQLVDFMRRGLPGCVLRRKVELFFSDINGEDSPFAIRCVLVLHASGDLFLRMDLRWFTMVEDDGALASDVQMTVNSIYNAVF